MDKMYSLSFCHTLGTQGQDKHLAAWRPTCCHQYTTLGIHNPFTQRLTGETCKLNMQREKQRTLDNRNNHFRSICTIFFKESTFEFLFFSLVRIGTRWKSNWRGGGEEARSRCSKAGWVYIPGLLWIGSSEARWRWRKECRQDGDRLLQSKRRWGHWQKHMRNRGYIG